MISCQGKSACSKEPTQSVNLKLIQLKYIAAYLYFFVTQFVRACSNLSLTLSLIGPDNESN